MSTPERSTTDQAPQIELTPMERRVLAVLEAAKRPMDIVAVASASLLDVDKTLEIVRNLKDKGVVDMRPPEPIRERVQVDENALQRVAG